jgi:hypothetical protein
MDCTPPIRLAAALASAAFVFEPATAAVAPSSEPACTTAAFESRELPAADYLQCVRRLLGVPASADLLPADALYEGILELRERDFTRPAPADVESMNLFVGELERRQAMRPQEWRNLVDVLLMNGRVAEAEAARQHVASRRDQVLPRLVPLAATGTSAAARYWTWDTTANVLQEHAVDLAHGDYVVVTSSTGCHFCNQLATALPKDPPLARAFHDHALWITRPDGVAFDLKETKAWDARHPETRLLTVLDLGAWPHPDVWATPFFYFIHDGHVVKTVRGYEPKRLDEIRDGFRSIGVSAADRCLEPGLDDCDYGADDPESDAGCAGSPRRGRPGTLFCAACSHRCSRPRRGRHRGRSG